MYQPERFGHIFGFDGIRIVTRRFTIIYVVTPRHAFVLIYGSGDWVCQLLFWSIHLGGNDQKRTGKKRKCIWIIIKNQLYTVYFTFWRNTLCFTQCMKFGTESEHDVYAPAQIQPPVTAYWRQLMHLQGPWYFELSQQLIISMNQLGIELGPIILLISCVKMKYFRLENLSILH